MIKFKNLKFKNFLSYGETFQEIQLDKYENTIIQGRNGTGKSSFLDALTFVLFGKPFRKISKQQLINSVNTKGCLVEIEFNIGITEYKIRRGMKPNIFEIYKDGKLQLQEAKSKDQQKLLEDDILKISYKSFTQIVVLGSSTFVPFMQLSQNDRRGIIEDLLDIQVFGVMSGILKGKLSVLKDDISNINYKIDVHTNKLEFFETSLSNASNRHIIAKDKLEADIVAHKVEITTIDANIQNIESEKQTITPIDASKLNGKLKLIERAETTISNNVKNITSDISFLNNNDVCCTCNQIIDDTFKDDKLRVYNTSLTDMQAKLTTIMQDKTITRGTITDNEMLHNTIRELDMQKYKLESSKKYHADNIANLETNSETEDNKVDVAEIQTNIDLLKVDINEYIEVKKRLILEQHNNTLVAGILKDDGIKTKIVKQYLPIMNSVINKYLKILDFHVDFRLDENFNETIRSRYRDTFTYASFSEGEKRKIDLSLLFAWREISRMRNNANTNILVLDEVLDGSLDTTAVENFMGIIKDISSEIKVYIISHKADIVENDYGASLEVTKLGNYSRMQYI